MATKSDPTLDNVPMTFLVIMSIQGVAFSHPLLVLLDSGSTLSWFNICTLPKNISSTTTDKITRTTMTGSFSSTQQLSLSDLILPEISCNVVLPTLDACLFNAD